MCGKNTFYIVHFTLYNLITFYPPQFSPLDSPIPMQLQRPIDRPMMRSSFLKRILIKQKKFKKEAQSAILIWKIEGYKKRLVNKVNKIIGRKRI